MICISHDQRLHKIVVDNVDLDLSTLNVKAQTHSLGMM